MLHHVCGKHSWLVAEVDRRQGKHGEIEENLKPLLKPRTPAFNQFKKNCLEYTSFKNNTMLYKFSVSFKYVLVDGMGEGEAIIFLLLNHH